MKLAAITIVYHPDVKELKHNVSSYVNGVDVLILWDNSEQPLDLSEFNGFCHIVIRQDGINHGLPKAYNWAIDYAKKNGYTHLMTMDQDSCFENFNKYRHWIETCNLNDIYSTAINQSQISTEDYAFINDSAQSGSVYPLSMIDELGPFREDFFIGMVDAEMALRAQEKGYKTFQYKGSNLIHHIGSGRKVKLLGHSLVVSDYNALRHYYGQPKPYPYVA